MIGYSNEHGNVIYADEVISKIVGLATMECYGVVGMVSKNFKEDIQKMLGRENYDKGIEVEYIDGVCHVSVHVVLAYGGKIDAIAQNVMDQVDYALEQFIPHLDKVVNIYVDDIAIVK